MTTRKTRPKTGMIARMVREATKKAVASGTFQTWWKSQATQAVDGDVISLNNSFIYRDKVKTNKSKWYVCIRCGPSGRVSTLRTFIGRPPHFNSDFKRFSVKSSNDVELQTISTAIDEELPKLGTLIFVLVGSIDDSASCEVPLKHSMFSKLCFDPSVGRPMINEKTIIINNLEDPERVWSALLQHVRAVRPNGGPLPESLEKRFAEAFQELQVEAFARVGFEPGSDHGILGRIAKGMTKQISQYETAMEVGSKSTVRDSRNDVLRIAYNFSTDATRLIELIVSISDLKPVILWCTIDEQLALAEAFRRLPWARSSRKPSMELYGQMISGVRNHAFHDFFPFQRSLDVEVKDLSFRAEKLRLFSAYRRKDQAPLVLEDQALLDLLTSFRRAPETAVAGTFWERNLDVMNRTRALTERTAEALSLLHQAT